MKNKEGRGAKSEQKNKDREREREKKRKKDKVKFFQADSLTCLTVGKFSLSFAEFLLVLECISSESTPK